MKKIFLLLFIIFTCSNVDYSFSSSQEEDVCIKQLSDYIQNDNRFNGIEDGIDKNKWLKKVLKSDETSGKMDISSYPKFKGTIVTNPLSTDAYHQDLINNNWFTNKDFIARRTNIATVVSSDNFVVSNLVWFWKGSTFNFPLSTDLGDAYNLGTSLFREYVLYTHHSFSWDFLSCGIIHIKPLGTNGYGDIEEDKYLSNVLTSNNGCSSSFEWEEVSFPWWYDFYKMKTDVCVIDHNLDDLLKMELISLAYDNSSDYFSDYIAHKLQVEAMRNPGNLSNWLLSWRNIFEKYLFEWTCLELLHETTWDLPSFCWWTYTGALDMGNISALDISSFISFNYKKNETNFVNFFFPKVNAAREFKNMEKHIEKSKWMVALNDISYTLYKKLLNIKNETFKNYLYLSVLPNYDNILKRKKEKWVVLTPYQETFLNCGISHLERNKILVDFLTKLDEKEEIDFWNLEYSNPKFWDCIVPYPDKKNIDKEIEGSFWTNKLLANKLTWKYKWKEIDEIILEWIEKEKEINIKYENDINELVNKLELKEITKEEYDKRIKELKEEKEVAISGIQSKYKKIREETNKKIIEEHINIDSSKSNSWFNLYIMILLIIIGVFIVLYPIINKNKNKS